MLTKRKILFITFSMPIGGIESALIALLNAIDYESYDVTLLLVACEGERLKDINEKVRVRSLDVKDRIYIDHISYALQLAREFRFKYFKDIAMRLFISGGHRLLAMAGRQMDVWRYLSRNVSHRDEFYDVVIDYSGSLKGYIIDKVYAKKKIAWNHFDYHYFDKDRESDEKKISKLDYVVAVSKSDASTLKKYFPQFKDKINYMHNIIDRDFIRIRADETVHEKIGAIKADFFKICSVGRLQKQKDFALAIEAGRILKKQGYCYKWYIIGEGAERTLLESMIKVYELQDHIFLLGAKENPYPYMKNSDFYVQTSVFEGRCISVSEAQLLYKPAVVTDVQGLNDIVVNQVTGFIVDRTPEAVAKGITDMTRDKIKEFMQNLEKKEIKQDDMQFFYKLIGDS